MSTDFQTSGSDDRHRAFNVVDAVDEMESHLGAYRALAQLAVNETAGGDDGLPQLRRSDLGQLLNILNSDLAARCAATRAAAIVCAQRTPLEN